jgi:hypothetical protein
MKKRLTLISVVALSVLLQHEPLWAQQCSDRDYKLFKRYDAYLDANPSILDDQARANFSARVGMRPAALKDLYFRCLPRWREQEPEAAQQVLRETIASMAAGGESPLTMGHSCNTLGYRYGHTATSTIVGKKPNLGWDFVMPKRCQNQTSTNAGIKSGTYAAAR